MINSRGLDPINRFDSDICWSVPRQHLRFCFVSVLVISVVFMRWMFSKKEVHVVDSNPVDI